MLLWYFLKRTHVVVVIQRHPLSGVTQDRPIIDEVSRPVLIGIMRPLEGVSFTRPIVDKQIRPLE